MREYHLTLDQFKELIAPFLEKMQQRIEGEKHKQLEFHVSFLREVSSYFDTYRIVYSVVGYITTGDVVVDINNCFRLHTMQGELGLVDPDELNQEEMQKALWKFCYNLFGEPYKLDLAQFIISERKQKLNDLHAYIKGIENADICDMYVVETEIESAKKEIAYVEEEHDKMLDFILSLNGTTCD